MIKLLDIFLLKNFDIPMRLELQYSTIMSSHEKLYKNIRNLTKLILKNKFSKNIFNKNEN